jgi:hypothetical protein
VQTEMALGIAASRAARYLRSLFVAGALAVIRYAKIYGTSIGLGSRCYWRRGPPRSPPLRLPTNSRGWPGP